MASGTIQVNGFKMELLWTNPSPTSSFSAQDVSVDLTDYNWFAILYRFGISSGTQDDQPLAVFHTDEQTKRLPITASGNNRTGGRTLLYSFTGKEISFRAASYNGAESNSNAIPVEIYGIKGLTV